MTRKRQWFESRFLSFISLWSNDVNIDTKFANNYTKNTKQFKINFHSKVEAR